MDLKGFFGTLLLMLGGCTILLAGGCVLLLLVFTGGGMHLQTLYLPGMTALVGALIAWVGVWMMNSAARDRAAQKAHSDEDRQKALEAALKKRAEEKKADEAGKGET
jgi:hypothetical protein